MFDHVTDAYSVRGINVKKSRGSVMGNSPKNDYEVGHNHELDAFLSNNVLFENIIDYDNIKKIFLFGITSNLPVHILLVGPPGSAKTLFLMECMKLPRSYFTLGSHSTKAGMIDYLFKNRPRNLIIDEIEYMPIKDQAVLLSLMESGILSETKFEKVRKSAMRTWVFASCNNEKKLLTPLLSDFWSYILKSILMRPFLK